MDVVVISNYCNMNSSICPALLIALKTNKLSDCVSVRKLMKLIFDWSNEIPWALIGPRKLLHNLILKYYPFFHNQTLQDKINLATFL